NTMVGDGCGYDSPRGHAQRAPRNRTDVTRDHTEIVVRIRGSAEPDGRISIAVESRGEKAVDLDSRIRLERETSQGWILEAGRKTLTMRYSCSHAAPPCLTLVQGAEFLPPAWAGSSEDGPCQCSACAPPQAGRYRFVVKSCHGMQRAFGEPF